LPENIAQTVQKVIQDLVAPDVRELKALVQGLQKQVDQRFEQIDKRFDGQRDTSEAQFKALMAAFGEFKAQSELTNMRVIASLSERVAVLESRDPH
jgi:capsule polysaccharide export protein KpsE/RkpR